MRCLLLLLVVLPMFGGCFPSRETGLAVNDENNPPNNGGVFGCSVDADCTLAAATCCECPSFAVPVGDPRKEACADVDCPPTDQVCANVRAACDRGACILACQPQACTNSCANGFALDPNGCLSCECAPIVENGCTADTDCVQTREDCCGCDEGGADTAVLARDQAAYDAMLACPAAPQCPAVDVCDAAELPQCIQGRCALLAGGLPPGACGRPDLPACPAGTVCTVNASDPANLQGVGVCTGP